MRALLAPAPHGGHRPSALTEVGYREPGPGRRWRNERARAALTRGPRQPEIGRPASERQPQKGRPVISMREDPDPVVGPHVRTPACAGPHIMMQARRNPRVERPPSPKPVCVCSDSAPSSLPAAEMYLLGYKRSAEARPVSQTCRFSRHVAYKRQRIVQIVCADQG